MTDILSPMEKDDPYGFNPDVGQMGGTKSGFISLGQALMLSYLNDWLGWFSSGFSGFHPFQKIKSDRDKRIKKIRI